MAYKFQDGAFETAGQLTSSVGLSGSVISADHFLGNGSLLAGIVANPMTAHLSMGDWNITNVGDIALDSISADGAALSIDSNWDAAGVTCSDLGIVTTADIDGGTWQGTIDGNWTAASQTCANLGSVTTCDINGGAIDGVTIGANSAGAGTFAAIVGTSLSLTEGNITNAGDINCDSISIDDPTAGLNISFDGADTGTSQITLDDGLEDALSIHDGAADWMVFNTNDEQLTIGNNSINIELAGQTHMEGGMSFVSTTTGSAGDSGVARINPSQGTAQYVLVSGSDQAVTLTLPEISGIASEASGQKGFKYFIKRAYGACGTTDAVKANTFDVRITASGADTIDGESYIDLESAGASVILFGTGSISGSNVAGIWHVF